MRTNRFRLRLGAPLAGLLLVACAASSGGGAASPSENAATVASREPATSFPPASIGGGDAVVPSFRTGEVPDEMLAEVVTQAAAGAGVDTAEVKVLAAESVTWSDGSLGCPSPGQVYTQALVPGFRVVVEIDGEELHFHASTEGDFAYCDDPQPPADDGRGGQ